MPVRRKKIEIFFIIFRMSQKPMGGMPGMGMGQGMGGMGPGPGMGQGQGMMNQQEYIYITYSEKIEIKKII